MGYFIVGFLIGGTFGFMLCAVVSSRGDDL